VRVSDFHFDLPSELIAQVPTPQRDASRLFCVDRASGIREHRRFADLPELLNPGDLLVLNNSRVIPARLKGRKVPSGGQVEILLAEETAPNRWWAMLRPGKRVRAGTRLEFATAGSDRALWGQVMEKNAEGHCLIAFEGERDVREYLRDLGEMPLPPYISRSGGGPDAEDRIRYQTVYAEKDGSVAAPTAGLHFTPELLERIEHRGVEARFVTLHVGLGTFAPVQADRVEEHHEEWYEVPETTAAAVQRAKREGRRVIAVGTTSARVLESAARSHDGQVRQVEPGSGRTRIFIYPPFEFRVVDALITNFHLPESTLLMLVSAFAAPGELRGRGWMLDVYEEAVRERYRFFSYGDAMFIR
jgi:S-adenosylmethionine:tRNA ribosyltransferase-isomerase